MNEENISEQSIEQSIEQSTEQAAQGGVAVSEEIPQITEEQPVTEQPTETVEQQPAAPEVQPENIDIQPEDIEKQIAEQQKQDEKLLAALDEVLERRSKQVEAQKPKSPQTRSKHATKAVARKGVGFVSLGIILIFMGILMIVTLTSSNPNYTIPLKLSPICAILIGAELLAAQIFTRGRPRISIVSLVISVAVVTGCCIICANLGGDYEEETVEYNNRMVAGEIYDRSYAELKDIADISSVKVDVSLNPKGAVIKNGTDALSAGDIVNITVDLGGVYNSPKDFAADCKKVIECYRTMGLSITDFHFKNESKLRSYTLDVEGKFVQDHDIGRLEEQVNYIYVDDFDYIEDLNDYVESTVDSNS